MFGLNYRWAMYRWPKKELVLGVTREIYLLERVLQVGDAMVTSELR